MAHKWHHEQIYRGADELKKLSEIKIAICGAGALGSNLACHLVRQGAVQLTVIDKDRVEEQNIGTQVYSLDDVGALKAEILRNLIYREVAEEINAVGQELTEKNASKLLKGHDLIIDVFDNSVSRRCVYETSKTLNIPCLHAGVNGDYGEIRWNEVYRVPSDAGDDICDYPLARNLILLVTSVTAEAIVRFIIKKERSNFSITLGDMKINLDSDF